MRLNSRNIELFKAACRGERMFKCISATPLTAYARRCRMMLHHLMIRRPADTISMRPTIAHSAATSLQPGQPPFCCALAARGLSVLSAGPPRRLRAGPHRPWSAAMHIRLTKVPAHCSSYGCTWPDHAAPLLCMLSASCRVRARVDVDGGVCGLVHRFPLLLLRQAVPAARAS
jgi:hypothetical protein